MGVSEFLIYLWFPFHFPASYLLSFFFLFISLRRWELHLRRCLVTKTETLINGWKLWAVVKQTQEECGWWTSPPGDPTNKVPVIFSRKFSRKNSSTLLPKAGYRADAHCLPAFQEGSWSLVHGPAHLHFLDGISPHTLLLLYLLHPEDNWVPWILGMGRRPLPSNVHKLNLNTPPSRAAWEIPLPSPRAGLLCFFSKLTWSSPFPTLPYLYPSSHCYGFLHSRLLMSPKLYWNSLPTMSPFLFPLVFASLLLFLNWNSFHIECAT